MDYEIKAAFSQITKEFGDLYKRLSSIESKFDGISVNIDSLRTQNGIQIESMGKEFNERIDQIFKRFNFVDANFKIIDDRLQTNEQKIDGLDHRLRYITKDIDDLRKLSMTHTDAITGLAEHIDKRFEISLHETKELIDQRLNTFAGTHGLVLRDAPSHKLKGNKKRH